MRGPDDKATDMARRLRRDATASEVRLWRFLRNRQLDGHKFCRQEPIGPYVVDFACRKSQLIIEVDGPSHDDPAARSHDARRTSFLKAKGYRVLRLTNDQVQGDRGAILETIRQHL